MHRSARGSWSCDRRASARLLRRKPPFSAASVAMGLDARTVDRHRSGNPARSGKRLENLKPDPLPAPPIEPVVDRCVGAIGSRTVAPTRTRTKHMNDPANHTPVINPMSPTTAKRHQRFDLRPLSLRQPIKRLSHPSLHTVWKLESHRRNLGNPLIEYGP